MNQRYKEKQMQTADLVRNSLMLKYHFDDVTYDQYKYKEHTYVIYTIRFYLENVIAIINF